MLSSQVPPFKPSVVDMSMSNCEPKEGEEKAGEEGQSLNDVQMQKITIVTSSDNDLGGISEIVAAL